jgi:hypothetical protein
MVRFFGVKETKWIYVMALDGSYVNKYLKKGGSLGDVSPN